LLWTTLLKMGSTDSCKIHNIWGIRNPTNQNSLFHRKKKNEGLWLIYFLMHYIRVMRYAKVCASRLTLISVQLILYFLILKIRRRQRVSWTEIKVSLCWWKWALAIQQENKHCVPLALHFLHSAFSLSLFLAANIYLFHFKYKKCNTE